MIKKIIIIAFILFTTVIIITLVSKPTDNDSSYSPSVIQRENRVFKNANNEQKNNIIADKKNNAMNHTTKKNDLNIKNLDLFIKNVIKIKPSDIQNSYYHNKSINVTSPLLSLISGNYQGAFKYIYKPHSHKNIFLELNISAKIEKNIFSGEMNGVIEEYNGEKFSNFSSSDIRDFKDGNIPGLNSFIFTDCASNDEAIFHAYFSESGNTIYGVYYDIVFEKNKKFYYPVAVFELDRTK